MKKIHFAKVDQQHFFSTLQSRVNEYFRENEISKTGNYVSYLKALVMFTFYSFPYILMIFGVLTGWWTVLAYCIMGIGTAGIGLCVMHDANHGSFSKHAGINNLMSYSMNLIGGSSFTWKIQHNVLHHAYTNVYELDEDIDDKPFLRLSPHGKLKKYHKFQHIYALFLYCLATFSWILFKDWKQMSIYNKSGLTEESGFNRKKVTFILSFTKIAYVIVMLIIPMIFFAKWYIVLLGFLCLHIIAGFSITVIFQLAHVVEGTHHFAYDENHQNFENTWAIHQINTTANFATKNKFLTWIIGGLNFQIEHHLFPHISHVHYPNLSKIVKKTVAEFGLPYHEFKNVPVALRSHLLMLKQFGQA